MMMLKNLPENFPLAKAALSRWEHDETGLDQMLAGFRTSSNAIYPFRQKGRLCFLRLAPTEEKLESNLLGELEFLDYLQSQGYPALSPLPANDGGRLLTLDTPWGQYFAMAFSAVPGTRLDRTDLSPESLLAYGTGLARLHNLSQDYRPRQRKWTHHQALDWAEAQLARYHAPRQAQAALQALRKGLCALPKTPETYGLIHYDFELDNVFYQAEAGICWAIDFDDGMYHWYAADLYQALDSLGEALSGEALAQARQTFLEGYRQIRPLPPDWEQALPWMERFVRLYGYSRLIRCVGEVPQEQPGWMAALRNNFWEDIRALEAAIEK